MIKTIQMVIIILVIKIITFFVIKHCLCCGISDVLLESVRLPHILITVNVVLDLTKVVCLHKNK